ncbi:peptide ABC transporter substrate-binding protein [Nostoc sp. FACHB-152]|uniref:peptide ABC transporter substrate-binding protein n=1 Tax=unclassified Nostoc TaxID=2593658 RepID=UPI0016858EAB|nr:MULTISPECIES: peptide ABC transporter substrate-binding protein [unclassified Nostoc]MBD2450801.1 peptide ABC transporter substrate-binding protein [Nostoc sp. FACHB-152]MBD2470226.1 peptide ABC transporter substrate-binding protein [Nostoc sp. FACHB-145]
MAEEFVSDTPDSIDPASSQPKRESVKILLIGSRRGINSIIHWLYRLGFAEVAAWSKPQIAPNSEDQQMMSITVKQVTLD